MNVRRYGGIRATVTLRINARIMCFASQPPVPRRLRLAGRRGEAPIDLGEALWQLAQLPEDRVAVRTEHLG